MARLTFRPPWVDGASPAWLTSLRNMAGAYIIRPRGGGRALYVGSSGGRLSVRKGRKAYYSSGKLYDTITRHFRSWSGDTAGKTYDRSSVEVAIVTCPPRSAPAVERRLMRQWNPRDNDYRMTDEPAPF